MTNAVHFKALQRKLKFRNPNNITCLNDMHDIEFTEKELALASAYLDELKTKMIHYTYPGHSCYPKSFYKMIEPPLFLEYQGDPVWLRYETLSVVGARNMHPLTQEWLFSDMHDFLKMKPSVALISGGAVGVDQASHLVCMRIGRPTVVVLPCGLNRLYPNNLTQLKDYILQAGGCLLSEFENEHSVRKSYFYHRNRLISAFSQITLVAQAERKSGTFLTVHHALQNGKTIITLPAHPRAAEFSGNKFLMREGAFFIHDSNDLHDFWEAESWSGRVLSSP